MIFTVCASGKMPKACEDPDPAESPCPQLSLLTLHSPFRSVRPEPPDRREAPRGDIALLEVAPRTGWGKIPRGFAKAISKLPKDDVHGGPVVKNLSFHCKGLRCNRSLVGEVRCAQQCSQKRKKLQLEAERIWRPLCDLSFGGGQMGRVKLGLSSCFHAHGGVHSFRAVRTS